LPPRVTEVDWDFSVMGNVLLDGEMKILHNGRCLGPGP